MNIALWIAQVLLALAFFTAGFVHAFRYERIKDRMKWMNDFSRRWVTFIGICEILGRLADPAGSNRHSALADSLGGFRFGDHHGPGCYLPRHPSRIFRNYYQRHLVCYGCIHRLWALRNLAAMISPF